MAQMIVELIRDNRKIVDRVNQDQIEMFVGLLKANKVGTFTRSGSKFTFTKVLLLFFVVVEV